MHFQNKSCKFCSYKVVAYWGDKDRILFQTLNFSWSFIHSLFCLTTGPKTLPKRFLHIVRSRASSFKWQYPLLSLRSPSSFLCLLLHLLVTSISPFIFPSITCFRRQFLRKMWPIQLAFRFLISCRIFLCSLALSNKKWIFRKELCFKFVIYQESCSCVSYVCTADVRASHVRCVPQRKYFLKFESPQDKKLPQFPCLFIELTVDWMSLEDWSLNLSSVDRERGLWSVVKYMKGDP